MHKSTYMVKILFLLIGSYSLILSMDQRKKGSSELSQLIEECEPFLQKTPVNSHGSIPLDILIQELEQEIESASPMPNSAFSDSIASTAVEPISSPNPSIEQTHSMAVSIRTSNSLFLPHSSSLLCSRDHYPLYIAVVGGIIIGIGYRISKSNSLKRNIASEEATPSLEPSPPSISPEATPPPTVAAIK